MRLNRIVAICCLIAIHHYSWGQFSDPEFDSPAKKEERYIYPINPGKPGSLAGNMGELRASHFHSGIDIRTDNTVGYPVYASKSGYISRISMSPSGYGNVMYITHPDGNTTLYAHLLEFKGAVADHVLMEQYRKKTFDIDLHFTEDQFPVKQGDTIALSGNTGSSGGPHVHFDIRDRNNNALDPLEFGFMEIKDNVPPVVEKVALVTLDANSRINDRFGRFEFHALRTGNNFTLKTPIMASGNIGVEIIAKDKFSPESSFYGGVKHITMKVDEKPVFSQLIDKVNIAETRSIFTLMDFKTMRTRGTRFYKLYIDDGNTLPYYDSSPSSGIITLDSLKESKVEITMQDAFKNTSSLSFRLKPYPVVKEVKTLERINYNIDYDILENTLIITGKTCPNESYAQVYSNGSVRSIEPDYYNTNQSVFLLDLRKDLPDSVTMCGNAVVPNIKTVIPSGVDYKYYGTNLDIQFPAPALYDTAYLKLAYLKNDNAEYFVIGERTTPLSQSIHVSLRPQLEYPKDGTVAVYRVVGRGYYYAGGEWVNGALQFSTREFGDFTIAVDSTAPAIRPVYLNSQAVRFKISDDLSGIKTYEANINGQWLLMHFDSKTQTIWSEKLNKKELLKGEFVLTVTDNAGNKETYRQIIQ